MLDQTCESVVAIEYYYRIYLLVLALMHALVTFSPVHYMCGDMISSRDSFTHILSCNSIYSRFRCSLHILPSMDLVGRLWLSLIIPTENYCLVLTPSCGLLFRDNCFIH